MRLQAYLTARTIEDTRSLDFSSLKVELLSGPVTLYRVASSSYKRTAGIWWFGEASANHCRNDCGSDPRKQFEWLRNVLAVCLNWSTFDQLQTITLHHKSEVIPVVTGTGLPMQAYKIVPDRKTNKIAIPEDYWRRKSEIFIGGHKQLVLPWIPHRIRDRQSL